MSPLLRYDPDEKNLPLLDHLEELRNRLIRCFLAVLIGTVVGYFLAPPVIDFLLQPLEKSGLVAQETVSGKVVVQEDGVWRFLNVEELRAPAPEAAWGMPGKRLEQRGWTVDRIEFYAEGAEVPFATFDSARRSGVIYLTPLAPFYVQLKTAVLLGLLFALPYLLYNLYAFIAPGLYVAERRVLVPILSASLLLFPLGAGFAYWLFRFALLFLSEFAADKAYLFNDIQAYLNLALTTMLAFGLVFQLPVVLLVLTRLGIVSVDALSRKRRHIVVGLALLAAIITPPDPFTMAAVAVPMYILFELSLIVARLSQIGSRSPVAAQGED